MLALLALLPAGAQALTNTAPPTISAANEREGGTVNGFAGTWQLDGSESGPITQTYQWRRCTTADPASCADIPGATGTSYFLTAADVGARIRLRETATCTSNCTPTSSDSAPTGIIRTDPSNDSPPIIGGTFREGETIGGFVGTWSGTAPIRHTVRWQRCASPDPLSCIDIPGANDLGYRLQAADVGERVRLVVAADNDAPSTNVEAASAMSTPVTRRRRPSLMSPFPKIAIGGFGRVRGTDVTLFRVTGPPGASVRVNCGGPRCPFRRVRRRIGKKGRIRIRGLERRLGVGTRIVVRVTATGVIGKYTRFRIRSLKRPARFDACLQPGASRPSRCP